MKNRHQPTSDNAVEAVSYFYDESTIPSHLRWGEEPSRQSWCELEADALAGDILNRLDVKERPDMALAGISELVERRGTTSTLNRSMSWSETRPLHQQQQKEQDSVEELKLVPSLASIWDDESRRRFKKGIIPTTPPVPELESGRVDPGNWYNEDELREKIERAISSDMTAAKYAELDSDDIHNVFLSKGSVLEGISTVFTA